MKKRVFDTFVILIILLIAIIYGYKFFAMAMGICAVLSFLEFFKYKYNNDLDIIKVIGILCLLFILFNSVFYNLPIILPVVISLLLLVIPIVIYDNSKKYNINDALYLFGIIVFLSLAYNVLVLICKIDVFRCIYVFLIAFMFDIYSYVGTSLIGRHKINKTNRTIEGSIVGIVMASLIGSVYHYNFIGDEILVIIVISFILSIASVLGDILFYNIKNYFNKEKRQVKVIDQFDSVLLAAILYIIVINIL